MLLLMNMAGIVPKCVGCPYVMPIAEGTHCTKYALPGSQWTRVGGCAMRPNVQKEELGAKPTFTDPLKASKQAMKAKVKSTKNKKSERTDRR